jgi:tape measure domain-containing protein
MAKASIAQAFVQIVPTTDGVKGALEKQFKPVAESTGKGFGGFFNKAVKATLAVGAAVATTALVGVGIAVNKGFGRLTAIENAQALLRGIGHDAESVDTIMGNALNSVRGTAFGLGDAAQVAAGAVAAGIKPGQELERILGIVADTAAVAGVPLGEIGTIMDKVTISNKAQNSELQQLAQRGIPVYQMLADQVGVTGDEIFDMASRGEISADMLATALEENLGGAALEMGNTVQGSMANVGAAVGRIGANLIEGVFAELPGFFGGVIEALAPLEEVAKDLGAELATALQPAMEAIVQLLPDLFEAVVPLIPALVELAVVFLELAVQLLPLLVTIISTIVDWLSQLARWMADNTGAATALGVAVGAVALAIKGVGLVTFIKTLGTLAVVLGKATLATLKFVLQLGFKTVMLIGQTVHLVVNTAATIAMTVATKAATLATKAFNLVLRMNPIGLVITAVLALVAGLIWFFTKTETGRKIFEKFTEVLKNAWETIKLAFTIIKTAVGDFWESFKKRITLANELFAKFVKAIPEAFNRIIDTVKNAGKNIINGLLTGLKNAWENVKTWFKGRKDAALDLLKNAVNWLKNIGKNIVDGLLNGLKEAWTAVTSWISGAAEKVTGPFKKILGISSPSKVFMEFGENIGEGLVIGMGNIEPEIENRVESLVRVPDVPSFTDGASNNNRYPAINYYAAPNESLDSEEALLTAVKRARVLASW